MLTFATSFCVLETTVIFSNAGESRTTSFALTSRNVNSFTVKGISIKSTFSIHSMLVMYPPIDSTLTSLPDVAPKFTVAVKLLSSVGEEAEVSAPTLIVAGASAYARAIDFKRFREIADEVGAYLMVDMAHIAGLVATGEHLSPIPYAHVTTTTTHKTLRGPRGGMILSSNEVNEKFNFNKAVFPGIQGGPLMHVIAAKAVCFKEALSDEFKEYGKNIVKNAAALAAALKERGFDLVSGGTDNHLMLVDLQNLELTGKEVEKLLDSVNITCNKNAVPNDPKSPFVTSGIRLGTAAITSRGFKEDDMVVIADAIKAAVIDKDEEKAKALVKSLTDKYPLYEAV